MDPVFFSIGSFSIRWYGFLAAMGFLAALLIIQINRRYAKLSSDQVSNIVMLGMISGVVGARIFYVAQNWSFYSAHPSAIIRIDQGGLVFYGGFILAFILVVLYVRKVCRADVVRVLDVMAPALAAAHSLGRIGCFFNGCCYGKPTSLFVGLAYPQGSEPAQRYGEAALHPVQLYEAGENLLCAILYFYLVRKAPRGVPVACYFIIYGILRFVNEFARGDHKLIWNLFTPAQLIGIVLITSGIGMLIYFLRRREIPSAES